MFQQEKTPSGKPQRGKKKKKTERKEAKEAPSCSGFAKEQQRAKDLSESNGILHLLKGDYII